jgi:P27 family predicted phage terminase small subunit
MAGQRQKHPDALQNKRGGRYRPLKLLPPSERITPACPRGVGDKARAFWKMIWSSPLGDTFGEVDTIALTRYVVYLDSWLEVKAEVEEEGVVAEGRRGEDVISPLARYWFRLEQAMRDLEKSYGLDALSRLRLGISIASKYDPIAALKSEEMMAGYREKLGVKEAKE